MLKLVAGTEFKSADGGGSGETEMVAVAPAAEPKKAKVKPPVTLSAEQKDEARKLILNFVVCDTHSELEFTVQGWIEAVNRALETGDSGLTSPVTLVMAGIRTMNNMGVKLSTAGSEFGMSTSAFATVVEPKKLARYIPELKKGAADLLGLALY
ncbi:hypothetical protein [Paraburkholderia sp. BL25I1N1]|uniref:hypothetical protein n=1 Tax=Paraburkholderia sp. BL25I1N1 TaxID=1938804 RepID=UPI000D06E64F|nr:hypothetical protein [Paraburkholderia sp. BL25I1N1]PRY05608.1 hypothetical protein B0G73_109205 [Paraburkholderia sp. BL25I1N1]